MGGETSIKHATGSRVPDGTVEGYAWLNVSGALGASSDKTKKLVTQKMTKEDISAAQKRSKEIWEALEARKAD